MTKQSQQDKEEFFEKFTQIINDYFDEYEYAKNKAKMGGKTMVYEFKSSVQVDNLWQWIESKKAEWQREAREEAEKGLLIPYSKSREIIGEVKERFAELKHKEWDWQSFYNGWLEGRTRMLIDIVDRKSNLTSPTNQDE